MNQLSPLRIGHGHDIHGLFSGEPLVLGGVRIDTAERGFRTHSDGDVLAHAVIDAIAGAMSDGDLGTHYPENDPAAEDARSLDFVSEFAQYMRGRGYEIVNIDSFVTLGTTRLRPFLDQIRDSLADALGVAPDRVSVKGRSHDGIAEVGRGEACSATATVLLQKLGPVRQVDGGTSAP